MNSSENKIQIGQKVFSVFGASVEQVAVVIGINSDTSIRVAKDAVSCEGAEDISLPLSFGLVIA